MNVWTIYIHILFSILDTVLPPPLAIILRNTCRARRETNLMKCSTRSIWIAIITMNTINISINIPINTPINTPLLFPPLVLALASLPALTRTLLFFLRQAPPTYPLAPSTPLVGQYGRPLSPIKFHWGDLISLPRLWGTWRLPWTCRKRGQGEERRRRREGHGSRGNPVRIEGLECFTRFQKVHDITLLHAYIHTKAS